MSIGVGASRAYTGPGMGEREPFSFSLFFEMVFAAFAFGYLCGGKGGSSAHHIGSACGFDLLPLLGENTGLKHGGSVQVGPAVPFLMLLAEVLEGPGCRGVLGHRP